MTIPRTLFALLLSLALIGAACGSNGDSTSTLATESSAGSTGELSLAGDLQVTSVDFATGVAVVTNLGTGNFDLKGHWICNRPAYAELPGDVLQPGEFVEVSLDGFSPDAGEVAVYSSDRFGDKEALLAYVGWGSGGGRQSIAVEAGIWSGEPVAPGGNEIVLTGSPGSADGWS